MVVLLPCGLALNIPFMTRLTVTYFFRRPRPEYHSIEQLFAGLAHQLNHQSDGLVADRVYCSHSQVTPLNLVRNCLHAKRRRSAVNHITGDVHYLALALPRHATVLTVHDCILLTRYPKWHPIHWFHYYVWYKWPISRAGYVTTISEKSKAELVQAVGKAANKMQVIVNYYDPKFNYLPRPFNSNCPTLLHLGTAPHKNLDRLINAITGLPCRLVIVGRLTEANKRALQTHLIDYEQHADISQEAVKQLYEQCDLVSFVSLYEGFGMPVLEGQVVGRPVVTSNISPMTEVGGTGACYVDPTDVSAIRRGILRVWQDEAYRAALITNGRLNAQQYTIERVSAQYAALYDRLAQPRHTNTMNTIA